MLLSYNQKYTRLFNLESVERPESLLRLDLTLESPGKPDDQQLAEGDPYRHPAYCVEVVLYQSLQHRSEITDKSNTNIHLNGLYTASGVDLRHHVSNIFSPVLFLLPQGGLDLEAAHEVEGNNALLVHMATRVRNSAPLTRINILTGADYKQIAWFHRLLNQEISFNFDLWKLHSNWWLN